MSGVPQILVSARWLRCLGAAALLALMAACGQRGPLYLPQGEAATGRASLPDALAPNTGAGTAVTPSKGNSAPPGEGASAPGSVK